MAEDYRLKDVAAKQIKMRNFQTTIVLKSTKQQKIIVN